MTAMLQVLPIQSKDRQEELCQQCHVSYNPDLLAYAAISEEKFVGICQFKLTAQGGLIYDLAKVADRPTDEDDRSQNASDFEALFVMGRGTLNFIDLCGVHYAQYVGTDADEPLLRAIGFTKNSNGIYDINLEGFFTDHCHNHAKES